MFVLFLQYFVYFPVLQSSRWGNNSLLLGFYCHLDVMLLLLFFSPSTRCRNWSVVCHCGSSWSYPCEKDFARIISEVLKSETNYVYPRWPLSTAGIAEFRHFHVEATWDNTNSVNLKTIDKTFSKCRKILV